MLVYIWILLSPVAPIQIMDRVYTESQYDRRKKKYDDFYLIIS